MAKLSHLRPSLPTIPSHDNITMFSFLSPRSSSTYSTIQSKMAEAVPDEDVTLPRGLWCISEIFSRLSLFNAFLRSISLFSFYLAFFSHKVELLFGWNTSPKCTDYIISNVYIQFCFALYFFLRWSFLRLVSGQIVPLSELSRSDLSFHGKIII